MRVLDDDLDLYIMRCAHEQKAHGEGGVQAWPTKTQCLQCSWALPNNSKHNKVSISKTLTDLLRLRIAQMPRSRDLAINVLTNR
jgi:hypothetical protein